MAEMNMFMHASGSQSFEPGATLFRQGETGDVMFAVVEGEVELTRNGAVVDVIGPGGIIGELALIDPAPRSATATATTSARVVPVDKKEFMFLVQEHPTFALQVMTVMADRIRKTNDATSTS